MATSGEIQMAAYGELSMATVTRDERQILSRQSDEVGPVQTMLLA